MFPDVSMLLTCLLITGTQWRKSWIGHPLSVIRLAAGYTRSPWDASAKSHQGCTTVNTMYSKVEECQQTWGSCQTATQAGEVIPCCLSHTSMYRGLAAALKVKKQSSRALNEFFFLQTKVEKRRNYFEESYLCFMKNRTWLIDVKLSIYCVFIDANNTCICEKKTKKRILCNSAI